MEENNIKRQGVPPGATKKNPKRLSLRIETRDSKDDENESPVLPPKRIMKAMQGSDGQVLLPIPTHQKISPVDGGSLLEVGPAKSGEETGGEIQDLVRSQQVSCQVVVPSPAPPGSELQTNSTATVGKVKSGKSSDKAPDMSVGRVNKEDNRYQISKILGYKLQARKEFFLIKWKGWSRQWNSWERSENVDGCDGRGQFRNCLVEQYFQDNPAKYAIYQKFHRGKRTCSKKSEKRGYRSRSGAGLTDPKVLKASQGSATQLSPNANSGAVAEYAELASTEQTVVLKVEPKGTMEPLIESSSTKKANVPSTLKSALKGGRGSRRGSSRKVWFEEQVHVRIIEQRVVGRVTRSRDREALGSKTDPDTRPAASKKKTVIEGEADRGIPSEAEHVELTEPLKSKPEPEGSSRPSPASPPSAGRTLSM